MKIIAGFLIFMAGAIGLLAVGTMAFEMGIIALRLVKEGNFIGAAFPALICAVIIGIVGLFLPDIFNKTK